MITTIVTIVTIAVIAGESVRQSTIVITWKPDFSDRSDHRISQRSLKSVLHMIATISAERFFLFSVRSDRSDR